MYGQYAIQNHSLKKFKVKHFVIEKLSPLQLNI